MFVQCPHIWQCQIDTWKIPHYCCASLWNPRYSENSDLLEHFTSTFSLVMPFSSPTLNDTHYHFFVGSFLPAITFMFSDWQGCLNSSNSSVHSLAHFNCSINFQSFSPNFLCAVLAAPITAYCLFSNLAVYDPMRSILKIEVLLPFLVVWIVHHFSKPPPHDLVGQFIHSNFSGLFVFETLISTHTLHS